jgi:Sybindin-like family
MQRIYGLYIISSADGLLYDALFGDCAGNNSSENTRIQLASAFASMSHIAKELSPMKDCAGITSLEAETFTVEVCSTSVCNPCTWIQKGGAFK